MHVAPGGILNAHSVAEAFLYVTLTCCPRCSRRPVRAAGQLTCVDSAGDIWSLGVTCGGCREPSDLRFRILPRPDPNLAPVCINPTDRPSQLIDVAGWLALFRTIVDGAANERDRVALRDLTLEAAQCLEEALRFYDAGQELPPANAFYSETSRQRFRDHPRQFARAGLVALRERLPRAAPPESGTDSLGAAKPRKKRWWKR